MTETSNTILLIALAGALVGLMLGITMVWTRFCTMGAVADIAISGNYGRMRSWLLAICVAIIGTQIASAVELIDITQTSYLQSRLYLSAAIIGGGMFGFGMVFACGCGARSLVMAGCGDLRALIAVMVLGTFAYMTIRGIFAVPRGWFYSATVMDSSAWLPFPSVDSFFADTFDLKNSTSRALAAITIIGPLLWFIFKDSEFRHSTRRILAGITVGGLVVAGWLATGWIVSDDFEEVPVVSLTFVDPVGDSLQYLMIWTGTSITFGVAVVGGTIIGGLITSIIRKEFYVRGFEDASEMGRYMGGGALMGMGGAIAGGCTFGQGITGVSTLGFASFLALGSIIIGAFIGIRCLEQGSLSGALKKYGGVFRSVNMQTKFSTVSSTGLTRQLQKLLLTAALLALSTLTSATETNLGKTEGQVKGAVNFEIPTWFKQSFLEITEDAAEAGENAKHLLLFFHLDNCPYCARMLKDNFNAEPNRAFIQQHFDSIEINIKGDREVAFNENIQLTEKSLAEHLKVLHTPTILFADKNNKAVLRIDGYRNPTRFRVALEYVYEKAYLKSSFSEFSDARLKSTDYSFIDHPAFSSVQNFEETASEPLAVIFEDARCEDCDEIHKTLFARKDVSEALSQLTVVRVDAMSSEDIIDVSGIKTTPQEWVKKLNITYRPGVVLFDRGKEIARIDNRLYSWHFNGFVKWVAGRHYEQYPDVFSYMAKLREQQLALGHDVSYVD